MNPSPPDPTEQLATSSPGRTVPLEGHRDPTCRFLAHALPSLRTPPDGTQTCSAAALTFTSSTVTHNIDRHSVTGTIDATTCGSFGDHLDTIVAATRPFFLDLSLVPFVSVRGLTLLETLAHTSAELGIPWALASDYSLHRFLALLNMDAPVPSFDTPEAALTHIVNALGQ